MKQVNKDYISVVRSNNGRLLFERIPMIKSDRVKDRLAEFLDDDRAKIGRASCRERVSACV